MRLETVVVLSGLLERQPEREPERERYPMSRELASPASRKAYTVGDAHRAHRPGCLASIPVKAFKEERMLFTLPRQPFLVCTHSSVAF